MTFNEAESLVNKQNSIMKDQARQLAEAATKDLD